MPLRFLTILMILTCLSASAANEKILIRIEFSENHYIQISDFKETQKTYFLITKKENKTVKVKPLTAAKAEKWRSSLLTFAEQKYSKTACSEPIIFSIRKNDTLILNNSYCPAVSKQKHSTNQLRNIINEIEKY